MNNRFRPSSKNVERVFVATNRTSLSIGPNENRRLEALQILRFASAAAVLLFHLGGYLERSFGIDQNYFYFGARGVDVFFVISGFIITHTSRPERGILYFVKRRVARVIPLYWLLTFAISIVSIWNPSLLNATTFNGIYLLKSLLFIPYMRADGAVVPMIFLGWSLNYEVFFYALFACSLVFRTRAPVVVCGIVVGLVVLGALIPSDQVVYRFYTRPILLEFVAGIALAWLYKLFGGLFKKQFAPVFFVSFLVCIALQYALAASSQILTLSALFLLVGSSLCVERVGFPGARVLVALGDASYSVYLVHPYVISLVGFSAKRFYFQHFLLDSVAIIVITLSFSLLLFRVVESPARRMIMKL